MLPDPPSDRAIREANLLLEPWRRIVEPRYVGLENIPSDPPMLLVGNHTIYGMQDLPLMMADLHAHTGLKVRALGDRNHFRVPLWGDLLRRFGSVEGNRANCAELLERGEPVLVFPGGAREVHKRRGERYKLVWKQRLGFAKLAIAHGVPIVPFASIGGDSNYDVVIDADSLLMRPLRSVLERIGGERAVEIVPPISRGLAGTPLPRLNPFYFAFGEPIDATRFAGREDDEKTLRKLRDETAAAIEGMLEDLLERRERDDPPTGLRRLARLVSGDQPTADDASTGSSA